MIFASPRCNFEPAVVSIVQILIFILWLDILMQGLAGVGGEDGQWQQVLVTAGPNV